MYLEPNWNPENNNQEPEGFTLMEVVYAFLDFALHVFAVIVLMLAIGKMMSGAW
jgi:hypothetical protein